MNLLLALVFSTSFSFASTNDASHRPQSFAVEGGKAVFADFSEANYEITYDLKQNQVYAKAEIFFTVAEEGFPIFDSVTPPKSILLDGASVESIEASTPNHETQLRIAKRSVGVGKHKFVIELPIEKLVSFKMNGVKSAFWTSDLDDRSYLERYLPTNFEFDQVKMSFLVKFIGKSISQAIYSNGTIQELDSSTYLINFPSHFTSSSIFFHTVPKNSVKELRFTLDSIDGRRIPAVVYFQSGLILHSLEALKEKTTKVFHELEKDLGPFPHQSITVYQAGAGGMEYCGATMSDFLSLGHELFHSYFARGVMPANGNAGWIDEALASWHDDGYMEMDSMSGTSGMSSHPYYTRKTDQAAYGFGERFMAYLNSKVKPQGGLKPFLRSMVQKKVFQPIFVEDFIQEMNRFYQSSFEKEFETYTYAKKPSDLAVELSQQKKNEIHQKMNLDELERYL